jgi:hypothetical protein
LRLNGSNTTDTIYQAAGDLGISVASASNLKFYTNATEQARIDSAGLFKFNSGYGSVATAYGCRAWVKFVANGTVSTNQTINGSGNVTSVFKNATGDFTINFTTALPDTDYAVVGSIQSNTTSNRNQTFVIAPASTTPYATSSIRVNSNDPNTNTALEDVPLMCVSIFR